MLALYANVLRERSEYPDAGDYMRAAFDLSEGRPLHERYIYPPLLAAACELLVPLGRGGMRTALWIGNVLAVSAFAGLLSLTLVRYGFDRRVSAGLVLAFMAVNVPVLRTLVYGQVNLHVANLILLALLAYPRLPVVVRPGAGAGRSPQVVPRRAGAAVPHGEEPALDGRVRGLAGRGRGRDLRRPRSASPSWTSSTTPAASTRGPTCASARTRSTRSCGARPRCWADRSASWTCPW